MVIRTTNAKDAPIRVNTYGEQISVNAETGEYKGLPWRKGFSTILVEPDGGTQGIRLSLSPLILYVYHYDASATPPWKLIANYYCTCNDCILDSGKSCAITVSAMAACDFLYIASDDRIRGLYFDLTATNCNSQTMAASYGGRTSFTSTCITDGTACTCKTMTQDGDLLICTVPASSLWVTNTLSKLLGSTADCLPSEVKDRKTYWFRLSPTGTLQNFSIVNLTSIHRDAAKSCTKGTDAGAGWFIKEDQEYQITVDTCVGGFSFVSIDAGTPTLNISWVDR